MRILICPFALALTSFIVLTTSPQAGAAIPTANLFAHHDAAVDAYNNAAKKNSETPVPALDGANVVEWWDQARDNVATSGLLGNQIVQSAAGPQWKANAINGLPAIKWDLTAATYGGLVGIDNLDGTDDFGTDLDTNNISYFIVFKQNVPVTDFRYLMMFDLHSSGGNENTFGTRYVAGNRETFVRDSSNVEQIISHDATSTLDTWQLISVVWDGDAGTLSEYINGQLTTSLNTAANTNTLTAFRFRYGADRGNGNSSRFQGEIAEGLIYNASLSNADREAVEQELLAKYQLLQHPGDANGDGLVNLSDLQILGDNWQSTTATWAQADFTGDGIVNLADLQILGDNWGFGAGPDVSFDEALADVLIPEPASLALLGISVVTLLRRRMVR
ncbi:MAG: PEP-CTERM sorting domain-containing protein [Phycisphaeraceae bacterium]|nr:PEP-CTERM sorting domain-containing protein [Phycisphaeraceae bacterium]